MCAMPSRRESKRRKIWGTKCRSLQRITRLHESRRANMIAKPPKRARMTPEERRARACRDRGAKLLLSAYRFLESEEFTHLPLAAQEELRDDIWELEDL